MGRCLVRLAVLVLDHPAADQAADLGIDQILAGENLDHARHFLRRSDIDALDPGVRMRRTQEIRMRATHEFQIVDEVTIAREQTLVFRTQDPGADTGGGGHGAIPPLISWPARRPGSPSRCCGSPCSGPGYRQAHCEPYSRRLR